MKLNFWEWCKSWPCKTAKVSGWLHITQMIMGQSKEVCALTCGAGRFGRAMGVPGGRLAPAHSGWHGHADQIDGVGLQTLQKVLGAVLTWDGQLDGGHLLIGGRAVGQTVRRYTSTAEFGRKRLPGHQDIGWTATRQAQLRGTKWHWGQTKRSKTWF